MQNLQALLLIFYVVTLSFGKISARYLTFYFDAVTLGFFQHLVGSLSLLLISYFFLKGNLRKIIKNHRQLSEVVVLGALWSIIYFLYIKGLSYTSATIGSLMSVFGLLMGIGLVGLFFSDEKKTIKRKSFIAGSIFAIFGVIGLNLSKGIAIPEYSLGIYYLTVAEILAGGSSLLRKRLVITTSSPVCLSSLITVFASMFFFIGALFFGDLRKIVRVSFFTNVILFGSGVYSLMIGAGLSLVYIKKFGLSKVNLIRLSLPVFTGMFAYLLLKESLSVLQVFFATILVAGCLVAIKKKA